MLSTQHLILLNDFEIMKYPESANRYKNHLGTFKQFKIYYIMKLASL